MAARKTTKPKSEKSAPRTRKKAEPAPEIQESEGLSRMTWGAIWAGLGVLALLTLLPIDGALLRWLHRFIGGFIGRVVSIMDDTLVIESSSDRTKLKIYRWAIRGKEAPATEVVEAPKEAKK